MLCQSQDLRRRCRHCDTGGRLAALLDPRRSSRLAPDGTVCHCQPTRQTVMTYETDPRDYALEQVEAGRTSADYLLKACLAFMSHDQVREMLDDNELSPRFTEA